MNQTHLPLIPNTLVSNPSSLRGAKTGPLRGSRRHGATLTQLTIAFSAGSDVCCEASSESKMEIPNVLGWPARSGRMTLGRHLLRVSGFLLARLVAAVIVKSRQMASVLRMPSAHVIPNGVDLDPFSAHRPPAGATNAGPRPNQEVRPVSLQSRGRTEAL